MVNFFFRACLLYTKQSFCQNYLLYPHEFDNLRTEGVIGEPITIFGKDLWWGVELFNALYLIDTTYYLEKKYL